MKCEICQMLRKHYPGDPQLHRMHCPACIYCGARLIQKVQRLHRAAMTVKQERCRSLLADWMAMGHSEAELRKLAKATAWAVEPTK